MAFEKTARRGVIVHLKNPRQARQLRRFGVVSYISNKLKYAVVYMDEADVADRSRLIERLGFVASVELSHWPEVDPMVGSDAEGLDFVLDEASLTDELVEEEEL